MLYQWTLNNSLERISICERRETQQNRSFYIAIDYDWLKVD